MSVRKSALAAAMILGLASAGSSALAQGADPVVTSLTASIEAALQALPAGSSDAQVQATIANVLAMSTATVGEKELALSDVKAAVTGAAGSYPAGSAADVQLAYDALLAGGNFTAAGGAPAGGVGFGTAGVGLGGGGGGSSYTPG